MAKRKLRLSVAAVVAAAAAVVARRAVALAAAAVRAAARRLAAAVVASIVVVAAVVAVAARPAAVVARHVAVAVVVTLPRPLLKPLRPLPQLLKLPSSIVFSDPQALTGRRLPCCRWLVSEFVERLNLTAGFSLSSFLGSSRTASFWEGDAPAEP